MRIGALLTVALVSVLSGCTGSAPSAPPPPSPVPATSASKVVADMCASAAAGGTVVSFDTGGKRTAGLTMGTGDRTVVLVHAFAKDVCQWLPYGRKLSTLGYRVLVFDMPGHGGSEGTSGAEMLESVVSAVSFARANGAKKVLLIGAGTGATAAAVAAKTISPPIDGFVVLSPTDDQPGLDGVAAMKNLLVPAEFFASQDSSGDYTRTMYEAMPNIGVYHGLANLDSTGDALAMLEETTYQSRTVADDIERFLTKAAAGEL